MSIRDGSEKQRWRNRRTGRQQQAGDGRTSSTDGKCACSLAHFLYGRCLPCCHLLCSASASLSFHSPARIFRLILVRATTAVRGNKRNDRTFGDEPAAALHEQPCYLPYPSRHSLHAGGFALACEWSRPVFDSPPAHTSQLTPAVSCQTVGETNTCSRNTQHIELARLSTWTALQPPAHELIKSLD